MAEKPTAAFVLSLIGGIFILLGAIVVMALASVIGSLMLIGGGDPNLAYLYGAVGLIFAILVLVGAVMLWLKPQQHVMWGVGVLPFSLFTIITTPGFFIGLILSLISASLGTARWPPPSRPIGVTLLAVLTILLGVLIVGLGLLFIVAPLILVGVGLSLAFGLAAGVIGAIVLVFGLIWIGVGVGLLHLRGWAWWLAVIVMVLSIVGSFASPLTAVIPALILI